MDANSENSKDAVNQKSDDESKEKKLDVKQDADGKSEAGTTEDDDVDNGEKENDEDKKDKKENSEKVKEEKQKGSTAKKGAEKQDSSAIPLGLIAKIDNNITNTKADGLQTLHLICFDNPGKVTMIKKNLRKFSGFAFDEESDEYKEKLEAAQKHDVKLLKNVCDVLNLDKKGGKEELAERICGFLLAPEGDEEAAEEAEEEAEEESEEEPRRSRKVTSTTTSGRPRRSTAGRGFNPDYSSSEESDERFSKTKGKRKKDDSDSGSDYNPSGGGSDSDAGKRRAPPRGQRGRPARRSKRQRSESEEESLTSDEESDEPKRGGRGRRRAAATGRSVTRKKRAQSDTEESEAESEESEKNGKKGRVNKNNKSSGNAKSKSTPSPAKGKARPKRTAAKTKVTKDQTTSEEEEEEPELDDKEDASEDEPLAKKSKTTFPTDDEIKGYVKEILDDANLEEITMKTVCKQVYAKFPQFDLSHKKDFIKATVKSLIAT